MARLRQIGSAPEAPGALTIGEGYLLHSDRVAGALIDLTLRDFRLHDADSLARLLAMSCDVLRVRPDRCSLATFALPLTIAPLIQTLGDAQQRAPDVQSDAILGALTDWLAHAWSSLLHRRAVRWIVTVPSMAPDTPPSGTWDELLPAGIVGQTMRLAGDPVAEALTRARRLVSQFAAPGMEPPPRLLRADAIRALLCIRCVERTPRGLPARPAMRGIGLLRLPDRSAGVGAPHPPLDPAGADSRTET